MLSKEQITTRIQDINVQINQLHDEQMKLVGQFDLLVEQEKTTAEEAKITETPK